SRLQNSGHALMGAAMKTTLRENQRTAADVCGLFLAIAIDLTMAWLPPDLSLNGAVKLFRRMVKNGMFVRHTPGNGESYFSLTRRAVKLLGLPPRRVGSLGWQALIQHIGVQGACVALGLKKISAADFRREFAELCPRRGGQVNYYAKDDNDDPVWI